MDCLEFSSDLDILAGMLDLWLSCRTGPVEAVRTAWLAERARRREVTRCILKSLEWKEGKVVRWK